MKMRWFWKALEGETNEPLQNPGRGWYQLYSFDAEEAVDTEALKWCIDAQDSIVFVLIDIGAYKETLIDSQGLEHIRQILEFFRDAGKDVVLRPVYDREGKGMEREPSNFHLVVEHIRQLGPVLKEYTDVIWIVQGVLVGNWGEMHGSRYLSVERLRRLWEEINKEYIGSFYLAVRRPFFWRLLETGEKNRKDTVSYTGRLGLFDDGIFGSDTHLGTFGDATPEEGWDTPWSPEAELEFENWLGNYVPCGGEVVFPEVLDEEGRTQEISPEVVIKKLAKMRVSYLNKVHDRKLLEQWEERFVSHAGIWKGFRLWEFIDRHLGYRFVIRNVRPMNLGWYSTRRLEVQVENCGFSGIYQETQLWLVLEGTSMEESQRVLLPYQARDWKGGCKYKLYIDLPNPVLGLGKVELYLELERTGDGRRILFANKGGQTGKVRLGTCWL